MARTNQDFSVYRGDVIEADIGPFLDELGDPLSLVDARWTLYPHPHSRRRLLTYRHGTNEVQIINMDAASDGVRLNLTVQQSRALAAGRYYWSCRGKPSSGSQTGATGTLTILESGDADEAPLQTP